MHSSLGCGQRQTRVLLMLEPRTLAALIKFILTHGVYSTRAVTTVAELETSVDNWRPHLLILDMDLDGTQLVALVNRRRLAHVRLPVIGLTRRGDLKTKLASFEAGVDDILTVPFRSRLRSAGPAVIGVSGQGSAGTTTPGNSVAPWTKQPTSRRRAWPTWPLARGMFPPASGSHRR